MFSLQQTNARKVNAAVFLEGDATGLAMMEKLQKKIFVSETVFAASKVITCFPLCNILGL